MRLSLFGEFELNVEGEFVVAPKPKKARLLLAYLALTPPHIVERQRLASLLWQDADPSDSLFNLRQTLAAVRREVPCLSPFLIAEDRRTLGLDVAEMTIDVLEFRRLVKSAPEDGVALYRGPLLPGFDQEWILPIRAELERDFLTAIESLADSARPREAVNWLRRSVEVDPFSEQIQQKLLIRLAESGDSAGLTAAYRQFQALLHREMNIRPSAETRSLYRRLMDEAPCIPAAESEIVTSTSSLPVWSTPLFGRDSDVTEVCRLLETSRVVTLVGTGGVGKTRLAIAVGEAILAMDVGVWFVDLASLSDPSLVAQKIGQSLGLREHSDREWTGVLTDALFGTPKLLILDNCEHLLEDCAALVERFEITCPHLLVLSTSRVPLGISVEQRFPVEPLSLPACKTTDPDWSVYSALALFAARASRANPKFRITTSNVADVISVCRHVDAMPLGIEMASAALAALSLSEVVKRLKQTHDFLRGPSTHSGSRHRTLNAVIDWSYSLLGPEDRSLLRKLSVFSGWWTLEHVESAFGPESQVPVVESVIRLVEASLVQVREGRYSLFETVRQFGRVQLELEGEDARARDRHLECIAERFSSVRENRIGLEGIKSMESHEADLDNARLALEWSIASGATEKGLHLVADAAFVMNLLGLDANSWLSRMLEVSVPDNGSPGRIAALRAACGSYGIAEFGVSQAEARLRALNAVEELAVLARAKNDLADLCRTLAWKGQRLTDPEKARSTLHEALDLNARLEDRETRTHILANLASLAVVQGSYAEAESYVVQLRSLAEQGSEVDTLAVVRTLQGWLAKEMGSYSQARTRLEQAKSLGEATRNFYRVRCVSQILAELHIDSGEIEPLQEIFANAYPDARKNGDWLSTGQVETISRFLAAQHGRYIEAADGLTDLVASFVRKAKELPTPGYRWAGLGLEVLAQCLAACGRKSDAARLFGAAQSMSSRDTMVISPSIRNRWARLTDLADFSATENEINLGSALTTEQTIALADEMEVLVCFETSPAISKVS